jgi:hypothetical protein
MWRGNRDEPVHVAQTTKPLQVITSHDAAHAEAEQVNRLTGREWGLRID